MSVPSNLVPLPITSLPQFAGTSPDGWFPYVYQGVTYKTQPSNLDLGYGTVTSVDVSGGSTGFAFSGGPITTSGSLTMSGTLNVGYGGTGQTSYTDGQLLIGNSSGNTLSKATLTAGAGITITNGAGTITIAAASIGTVTSVNVSGGTTGLSFSGGPVTTSGTITAGGTLIVANGGTGLTSGTSGGVPYFSASSTMASSGALTASAIVLGGGAGAAPTSLGSLGTTTTVLHGNAAGAPTFGAVSLPADVSGTLPIANGGTNIATYTKGDILYASATNVLSALPAAADGTVLSLSGGVPAWTAAGGTGTVTSVGGTGTVNGITLTGTVTTSGNLTLGGALSGVSLTTQVSGVLPVGNGGTNASTPSITAFNNITGYTTAGATGTTSSNLVFSTSPTLVTPLLGTPTSGVLTNCTGLPISTGVSGLGTGIATALAVNTGSAGAPVLFNGAGGTPSALTLTNATGLPVAGITSSTSTALGVGSLELGNASDTTLSRSSAGVLAVEGVVVPTVSSTNTLTNKRITARVVTDGATSGTMTPTGDTADQYQMLGLTGSVTIAAPSGTPTAGQKLILRLKDNGTGRGLTWNATYVAIGVTLPTTTVASKITYVGCIYNATDSQWDVVSVTTQA